MRRIKFKNPYNLRKRPTADCIPYRCEEHQLIAEKQTENLSSSSDRIDLIPTPDKENKEQRTHVASEHVSEEHSQNAVSLSQLANQERLGDSSDSSDYEDLSSSGESSEGLHHNLNDKENPDYSEEDSASLDWDAHHATMTEHNGELDTIIATQTETLMQHMKQSQQETMEHIRTAMEKQDTVTSDKLSAIENVIEDAPSHTGSSAKLTAFKGNGDDVRDWLQRLQQVAYFNKWNEEKQRRAIPIYLEGSARTWFNTLEDAVKDDYKELLKALEIRFSSDHIQWELRHELLTRKQGKKESVGDYADAINRLCQRLKIPTTERMNYLIQGLRDEIKEHVILGKPKDCQAAEELARQKDSALKTVPKNEQIEEMKEMIKNLQATMKQSLTPTAAALTASQYPSTPEMNRSSSAQCKTQRASKVYMKYLLTDYIRCTVYSATSSACMNLLDSG